ncbi:MAG: Tm-1-like ATP-binding domain-containing protein [Acidobacteriota bacterium]
MSRSLHIVLIGTLDTKGHEIAYVRRVLERLGAEVCVLDSGILGEPVGGCVAEVPREEVALAGGHTLTALRNAGSRGVAVEGMAEGVREICLRLLHDGRLEGVLCLGGAEGALLGSSAMQALPLGVPKVLVSPVFSGRRTFGSFVGESDILLLHSVVDISGLNPLAEAVFNNAAAAVVGMVRDAGQPPAGSRKMVGVTMLGNSTPGVTRLREVLERSGQQCVVFHANGVGGPAMEKLAESGALNGVVDYTLCELSNRALGGLLAAGPDRLRVVGRLGLPQVVVPGCVDFFNLRPPLPARFHGRQQYLHNPISILVRLSPDEMAGLGRNIAERLNGATGPLCVVAPTAGFSINAVAGGALWDAAGDTAFIEALEDSLRSDIPLERVDADVNDPTFAEYVARRFLEMCEETGDGADPSDVPPEALPVS